LIVIATLHGADGGIQDRGEIVDPLQMYLSDIFTTA